MFTGIGFTDKNDIPAMKDPHRGLLLMFTEIESVHMAVVPAGKDHQVPQHKGLLVIFTEIGIIHMTITLVGKAPQHTGPLLIFTGIGFTCKTIIPAGNTLQHCQHIGSGEVEV